MALSYPPAAPQRGDRTTFAARVDAFITWLIGFVSELISVVANLNSLAAGGAYSIQYTYRSSSSYVGSSAGGILAIKASSIQLDTKSVSGASVAALLSATGDSTSTLKGFIRLQKVNDTSKWAVYSVTSYVAGGSGLYGDIFGTLINSSTGSNPFADGESVMLFFDRTGDKGDVGPAGSLLVPLLHVREEYTSGTNAPTLSSSVWNTRVLNATKTNTISGASVASSQVTLTAGTYDFEISAPAFGTGFLHRVGLYNVTDSTFVAQGQSREVGPNAYSTTDSSRAIGRVTIAATKVFELRHYSNSSVVGGRAVVTGSAEAYAEIRIEKVA